jgi:hypothetical protein
MMARKVGWLEMTRMASTMGGGREEEMVSSTMGDFEVGSFYQEDEGKMTVKNKCLGGLDICLNKRHDAARHQ